MIQERQRKITEWLMTAGEHLYQTIHQPIQVRTKTSQRDLVTEMDVWVEKYLVEKIRHEFPEDLILGEEGCGDDITSTKGTIWVIDPIDGTLNFVKAKNYFAIMIGIYQDGEPAEGYIYDVMNKQLYAGVVGQGAFINGETLKPDFYENIEDSIIIGNTNSFIKNKYHSQLLAQRALGVRSLGSAGLQIITVLKGESSLYFSAGLDPWDFAAGVAIATAIGIKSTTHLGEPLSILKGSPVLIAHPKVHEQALTLLH